MLVDVAVLVEVEAEEQLEVIPRVGVVEELLHCALQPVCAGRADVERERRSPPLPLAGCLAGHGLSWGRFLRPGRRLVAKYARDGGIFQRQLINYQVMRKHQFSFCYG